MANTLSGSIAPGPQNLPQVESQGRAHEVSVVVFLPLPTGAMMKEIWGDFEGIVPKESVWVTLHGRGPPGPYHCCTDPLEV